MANATKLIDRVPVPAEFYHTLSVQFETLITSNSSNPGKLRVFDGVFEQIRGWIWLPQYKDTSIMSPAFRPMLDLLQAYELTLRCTGCQYSGPRQRFFHVGTNWAPNDTLPNPWLDDHLSTDDEKQDRWRNHTNYGLHINGLVSLKTRLEKDGKSFGWAGLANEIREHGWLLNPNPRKKRVTAPDPVLAELERLGLR